MSQVRQFVTDDETEKYIQLWQDSYSGFSKSEVIRLAVAYAITKNKDFKAWLEKQGEAVK